MMLLFRADASERIGTGHIMRCLSLARRWRDQGQHATFATAKCPPGLERRIRDDGFGFERLTGESGKSDDAVATRELSQRIGAAAVVADGYDFTPAWHKVLHEAKVRTLLINDDPAVGFFPAEVVLNQNVYATEADYAPLRAASRFLLGPRFALIRPEFLEARGHTEPVRSAVRNVLVTMGGSDPHNVSRHVIDALAGEAVAIRVIAGGGNPWLEELRSVAQTRSPDVRVLVDVSNMAEHMAWADVAVTAAGSTALELACLGLPALYIVTADNQRPVAAAMEVHGAGVSLGWHADIEAGKIVEEVWALRDPARRAAMRERGRALVDGGGTDRVLLALRQMLLTLRPAGEEDTRAVWEWVNDPMVRAMSFSQAPIPWADHVRWWAQRVASGTPGFYIGETNSERIGYVRFDRSNATAATVSLALAPAARGRRLGAALLDAGCLRAFESGIAHALDAYIRPENGASIRCFEAAGFIRVAEVEIKGQSALKFTRNETGGK